MEFPEGLSRKLSAREKDGTLRTLQTREGLIDFYSNDYLGFASHPILNEETLTSLRRPMLRKIYKAEARAQGSSRGILRPMRNWNRLSDLPTIPDTLLEYVTEAYINNNVTWLGFNHKYFFKGLQDKVSH